MKIIKKTIYVSNDGNEFDTENDCIKWENRKFFKELRHLSNEEIVGLLKELIFLIKYPQDVSTVVCIYVKKEWNYGNGFEFKVIIDSDKEDYRSEITGAVQGCCDIEIIDFDWAKEIGFSVKGVYNYLNSLNFFNEFEVKPINNPNIKEDFTLISTFELKGVR